jgi:hypothetical protein
MYLAPALIGLIIAACTFCLFDAAASHTGLTAVTLYAFGVAGSAFLVAFIVDLVRHVRRLR